MSSGQTFERVYASLKAQVVEGRYAPGERLEPGMLADELFASVTPVRDALHRLVGEGLIVSPRADGFHMPMLTEPALRDLYAWNRAVVLVALAERSRWRTLEARPDEDCAQASMLFASISNLSGNDEHRTAVLRLNERLEAVRRAEAVVVADEAEVPQLATAFRREDRTALRAGISRYHRRRLKLTPDILTVLHKRLHLPRA
jgi:DNA-binding transcriptional MocR family regulator